MSTIHRTAVRTAALALAALLLLPAPPARAQSGPSFDCARAGTATEGAICAVPALAALDRALDAAYRAALPSGGDRLRARQRAFIEDRDRCGASAACLTARMRDRLAALTLPAGDAPLSRADLAALQSALARLGLYDGAIDGLTGPRTERAIAALRRDANAPATPLAQLRALADSRARTATPAPPRTALAAPVPTATPATPLQVFSGANICKGGDIFNRGLSRKRLDRLRLSLDASGEGTGTIDKPRRPVRMERSGDRLRLVVGEGGGGRDVSLRALPGGIRLLTRSNGGGACHAAWAGLDTLPGLSPAVSGEGGLTAFCSAVLPPLLASAAAERAAAVDLKTRYSRLLRSYDVDRAALHGLLSDAATTQAFGAPWRTLDGGVRATLFERLALCALLHQDEAQRAPLDAIFHNDYGITGLFSWANVGLVRRGGVSRIATLGGANSAILGAARDAALATQSGAIAALAPTRATALLGEVSLLRSRVRTAARQAADATATRTATDRFAGAPLPAAARAAPDGPLLDRLAAGATRGFSQTELLSLSVMAANLAGRCTLPVSPADAATLRGFAQAGLSGAGLGAMLQPGGIAEVMGQTLSQAETARRATATAAALPCADPATSAVASALVAVAGPPESETGDDPLFARSCAVDRPMPQCQCIARYARQVIPGIDARRYTPGIVNRVGQRDLLVGIRMGVECGL